MASKKSPVNIATGLTATATYGRSTFTGTIAQVDPKDHWGDTWVKLVDGWRTAWVLNISIIEVVGKAA